MAWADRARTGYLKHTAAWLKLMTTLLLQIYYVPPATNLNQHQYTTIMQPYLQIGLAAATYLQSFPWAIGYMPAWHFGLGLTNLHPEQGIKHLLTLLRYSHYTDDLTGQLLQGSLEYLHLEIGFSDQISCCSMKTSINWPPHHWSRQYGNSNSSIISGLKLTSQASVFLAIMTNCWCHHSTHSSTNATYTCKLQCRWTCAIMAWGSIWTWLCGLADNTRFHSGYTWPRQSRPPKTKLDLLANCNPGHIPIQFPTLASVPTWPMAHPTIPIMP